MEFLTLGFLFTAGTFQKAQGCTIHVKTKLKRDYTIIKNLQTTRSRRFKCVSASMVTIFPTSSDGSSSSKASSRPHAAPPWRAVIRAASGKPVLVHAAEPYGTLQPFDEGSRFEFHDAIDPVRIQQCRADCVPARRQLHRVLQRARGRGMRAPVSRSN